MIFAENCMFKGIERIVVLTFALLVATLLLLLGIADAMALRFVCINAILCSVVVYFSFFFARIVCRCRLHEEANLCDETLPVICNTIFTSFENKKSLDARRKCCGATSKAKLDDGSCHPRRRRLPDAINHSAIA